MKKYIVNGMSCAACQNRVEKAASQVNGVSSATVSLLTNTLTIEGDPADKDIIKAVENAGYSAKAMGEQKNSNYLKDEEDALDDHETPKLIRRLIYSLVFLLILMYITMGHNMLNWPLPGYFNHNHLALAITQMLLALIVMYINRDFFISGFKALIQRSANMDSLVALGSSISFLWSLYVLYEMCGMITQGYDNMALMDLYHNQLYFESAAMIPALITVGKTLEAKSKGKTTDALKSLMKLAPKTATLIKDNKEVAVDISEVKIGDIFVVKPGESIPVDGIIIEGSSAVDESSLTGESIPVDKIVNDKISAATLNTSGYLKAQATRVGEDTTFAQIIKMVSDAAGTKAPIARIADKVSSIFVPGVIAIAVIVFIIWLLIRGDMAFALERAIAVLVISCPCALGLATPVAIMVGNGMGAKNGILFKTSESLENTGKLNIVALDKTGTITYGEMEVKDIYPFNNYDENKLLQEAYSLEVKSEHPLAKAIVKKANENNITLIDSTDFKVLAGNGVSAKLNDVVYYAGSEKFIGNLINIDDRTKQLCSRLASEGKTPLFFIRDNKLIGLIAVADKIKEDSKQAISDLRNLGIKTVMLTGDNEKTAKAIAQEVGVDKVIASVLPDGKEKIISSLQKDGRVAMVGDGINDAPALKKADIGIAIGAGTDVAIDSADIVLMNSKLSDVVAAIRLSRETLKNIHENLFWAFAYNVLLIPMAAGLYPNIEMNPMWGAAAMSLSSFTVCMNALRLNLYDMHSSKHDRKYKSEVVLSEIKDSDMTIIVEGMMCENCEKHVKEALEKVKGIKEAQADHNTALVELKIDEKIDENEVAAAINKIGYKYGGIKND